MIDLITRIESGTGADRELDLAIATTLFPDAGACTPLCAGDEPIFWHSPLYKQPCPPYTASLDAAIALTERLLPGCNYLIGKGRLTPEEPLFGARILSGPDEVKAEAEHATSLSRALLAATVRAHAALKAKETSDADA